MSRARTLIVAFLLLMASGLAAQSTDLATLNQWRLDRQRTAMLVLGGWAMANITTGIYLRGRTTGPDRYFHTMNAAWNAVNLGIAAVGYWSSLGGDAAGSDLYTSVQQHFNLRQILLFNAGLDVGYMLGGLYLTERAKTSTKNPDRLRGFGRSIILQGGFLFAFDLVNYFIHAGQFKKFQPLLGHLHVAPEGMGLVFTL